MCFFLKERDVRLSLFHRLPVFHTVWLTDSEEGGARVERRQMIGSKLAQHRRLSQGGKPWCCERVLHSPVQTKLWHVETLKNRIQVTRPAGALLHVYLHPHLSAQSFPRITTGCSLTLSFYPFFFDSLKTNWDQTNTNMDSRPAKSVDAASKLLVKQPLKHSWNTINYIYWSEISCSWQSSLPTHYNHMYGNMKGPFSCCRWRQKADECNGPV